MNNGSTPSKVNITDTVPGDVILLSGSTMLEEYLEANKEVKLSYKIRSSSEIPFKLPAAEADYFELGDRGAKISTKSQEPLIRIKAPPTPVPTLPAPVPTIEPEIEALLAPVNDPSEGAVPVVDVKEQPEQPEILEQPEIAEQEPVEPSIDSNVLLKVILGCDNIVNTDPQYNEISEVCSLVQ